ncbi:MAG TPA: TIGR01777 family oxidoreductase [Pyrinomonadaceae bacterium]|jgi:uncharacterized protein (TIGR01777 family)|nr:TIGR01777 family oxidoreductase [Pyrinomonadaceae bacterium]
MKIIIPGGTGQVGTVLARSFQAGGHEVVVLSRRPEKADWRTVSWDAETLGDWANEIDGADVVINLAGRSVNCRYTPENRRQIMDSRIDSARVVGEAIKQAANPPKTWLQMSTATIYAHRFDAPNDDVTGIIGGSEPDVPRSWDFSIDVARNWEKTANDADTPHTRKVMMRAALVLSPGRGGIFDTLLSLVRMGLGGTAAGGRQYISWIHEQDFIHAVNFLIEREDISGAINLAAPNPLPQAEFMRILRKAYGMPVGLPAMKWMLKLGALLMQSETELILKSRRVVPRLLLDAGFTFDLPEWKDAARDLCEKWREQK